MDFSECRAGTILWTFVLTACCKIVDASCGIFSLFPALVLQAVHYMRKKGFLQSGRLSERAASKLALNVLGMSTLRLIAKSLHRVGFAETRR